MADNKIVHRVSLEGADKVSKQLESIGLEGEKAFKKVKQSAEGASVGGGKGAEALGGAVELERGREAAERFREVLHTLHPVLGAAGLEIANLGAYGRLAGAGLGFLGAAIAGSLLLSLAKLGDEADKAKRRLDLLSGAGKGGGDSQFEGLKKTARDLGVDSSDIAPAAETLFRSQQNSQAADRTVIHPDNFVAGENEDAANRVQVFSGGNATPSGGLSGDTINTAIKAVAEAGKLDRTSPKESTAALASFYESTKGGKGQITVDAYDTLVKASPAIGDAIAKAASGSGAGGVGQALPAGAPDLRAFLQRGGKLTGDQVLTGLARTEPELHEKAEAVPPGVTESFEHLEAAAKRLAEAFSGDVGIAGAVEKIAKAIDDAADNIDKTLHPRNYEPGGPKFVGPVSQEEKKEYSKPDILDVGKALITGESDERFKDSGAIKAAKLLRDGPAALQKTPQEVLGPTVDFLQKYPTSPETIEGNTRAPLPPFQSPFTREQIEKTVVPSPFGARTPKTPEAVNGPRSEAVGDDVTRQVADLGTAAEDIRGSGAAPSIAKAPEVAPSPPAANPSEFQYIPPPKEEFQYIPPPAEQQPQYIPPPATNGPRSEAAEPGQPPQQPQQVADLGSVLQSIFGPIAAALNNAKGPQDNKITGPVDAIGIRGEAAPTGDDATRKVADLGAAAEDAAAKLRGVEAPSSAAPVGTSSPSVTVATGGHIRGPGTATSDDIPAMLSDGEFVTKAAQVQRIGVDNMHALNNGMADVVPHYADGGEVDPQTGKKKRKKKHHSQFVVTDEDRLQQDADAAAYDKWNADTSNYDAASAAGYGYTVGPIGAAVGGLIKDGTLHLADGGLTGRAGLASSDPVPHFSTGGLAGNAPSRLQSIIRGFAGGGSVIAPNASSFASRVSAMGLSSIDVPHLAIGGMPDIPSADLSKSSAFDKPAASSAMEHWGTIDMRSDHGDFKVATERDTMRHLSSSAQKAKRFSTGAKPSWYGGRG